MICLLNEFEHDMNNYQVDVCRLSVVDNDMLRLDNSSYEKKIKKYQF